MSYVRVSIMGSSQSGEVWSINPVFDPTGEFPGGVDQTALDSATDAIIALVPGAGMIGTLSTALSITTARCEVRDDSTDDLIGISTQVRATAIPGTGTPSKGPQSAMVISLRTATPGASGRGRLYWPFISGAVTTGLRISPTDVSSVLSAAVTYFHAIEGALATAFPTIGFDLAVRSRLTHTTPHVNKLQLGNVIDNQRRRRDKMVEDYVSVAF